MVGDVLAQGGTGIGRLDVAGKLCLENDERHDRLTGGFIGSAHDLSDGGLAQALAECVMRFGVGARVWLDDIISRDAVDATNALFSESTGRVLVSVPREDDVKFLGLCEARNYPVLRIGVTDGTGANAALEVQGQFTASVAEIRDASNALLLRAGQKVGDTGDTALA